MISRVPLLIEAVDCSRKKSYVEEWTGSTLRVPLRGWRKVPANFFRQPWGRDLDLCLGKWCQIVGGNTLEGAHRRCCACGPFMCF